jgi:hypothetical protein
MLFMLAWFNAILQERQNYVPIVSAVEQTMLNAVKAWNVECDIFVKVLNARCTTQLWCISLHDAIKRHQGTFFLLFLLLRRVGLHPMTSPSQTCVPLQTSWRQQRQAATQVGQIGSSCSDCCK